jgi:four helix bundle protein
MGAENEDEDEGRGRLGKEASKQARPHSKNHLLTYSLLICYIFLLEPLFDHEKLNLYRVELAFIAWIADFLGDVAQSSVQYRRELIEQLDRASLSVLLNTAEGNGKRQGRQRAKFFDDARGSAFECAACLDASVAKRFVSVDRVRPGKEMLARVVAMLTRLIDRFDADDTRNPGP